MLATAYDVEPVDLGSVVAGAAVDHVTEAIARFDSVIAASGLDRVSARAAFEQVPAVPCRDRVVAQATEHGVRAGTGRERVVAAVPFDAVVSRAGEDPVVAGQAADDVEVRRAVQDVVPCGAHEAARIRSAVIARVGNYDVDPPAAALLPCGIGNLRAGRRPARWRDRVHVVFDLLGLAAAVERLDIERVLVLRRAPRHVLAVADECEAAARRRPLREA